MGKNYWGISEEILIKDIKEESNPVIINRLVIKLLPSLEKLIKGVINSYYFTYINSSNYDEIINEIESLMITKLDLYDSNKATAYSWLSNVAKNYMYTKFVRTTRDNQFNADALRNNIVLFDDSEDDIISTFVSYDKDYEIINPISIVLNELNNLIKFNNNKNVTKYLVVMRDELIKLQDDFSYERWIINIINIMDIEGVTLKKIFDHLGFNSTQLISIHHNMIDKSRGRGIGLKRLTKEYDWKYDSMTPLEEYNKIRQYSKRYYKKIKDKNYKKK